MDFWEYQLPPVLAAVRPAAVCFRTWAEQRAGEAAAADCELALVEACNNVISHNSAIPGPISLRAEASPSEITLIIRDNTDGFDWPAESNLPDAEDEHGRGLFLMRALMSNVEYHRAPGANELRLHRRL